MGRSTCLPVEGPYLMRSRRLSSLQGALLLIFSLFVFSSLVDQRYFISMKNTTHGQQFAYFRKRMTSPLGCALSPLSQAQGACNCCAHHSIDGEERKLKLCGGGAERGLGFPLQREVGLRPLAFGGAPPPPTSPPGAAGARPLVATMGPLSAAPSRPCRPTGATGTRRWLRLGLPAATWTW